MFERVLSAIFMERWHWFPGGVALGAVVPVFYFLFNTSLGVSTAYGNIARIVLRPRNIPWFNSDKFGKGSEWRLFFIAGIFAGGFLSGVLSGNFSFGLNILDFTGFINMPVQYSLLYFFSGGILLGLGSRLAGGCTSGHTIHGMAQAHFSSFVVTLIFVLFGVLAANAVLYIFN